VLAQALAVKTTCSLARVSVLMKLVTILLILTSFQDITCSEVVIVHFTAYFTYYLLKNLLITVRIVNIRPFVEQIHRRLNRPKSANAVIGLWLKLGHTTYKQKTNTCSNKKWPINNFLPWNSLASMRKVLAPMWD